VVNFTKLSGCFQLFHLPGVELQIAIKICQSVAPLLYLVLCGVTLSFTSPAHRVEEEEYL
jgi:hypothetical protein